jgi:hypothetical protein
MLPARLAGRFYDRFKVIGRFPRRDGQQSSLLGRMLESFNGKPILWRFYGVWGSCSRQGAVAFLNLDFCTGGRLKNSAFSEGAKRVHSWVIDIGWTLEARCDEEMPEVSSSLPAHEHM